MLTFTNGEAAYAKQTIGQDEIGVLPRYIYQRLQRYVCGTRQVQDDTEKHAA